MVVLDQQIRKVVFDMAGKNKVTSINSIVDKDINSVEQKPKLELDDKVIPPVLTPAQQKKKEEQAKKYWNTMITRAEAYGMVQQAVQQNVQQAVNSYEDRIRMFYVTIRSLTEIMIEKNMITPEEMDTKGKAILEEIFGKPEDQQAPETPDVVEPQQ